MNVLVFIIEQLNCWSSEKDQNQEFDFEISGAFGTKNFKVVGKFKYIVLWCSLKFCFPIYECLAKLAKRWC